MRRVIVAVALVAGCGTSETPGSGTGKGTVGTGTASATGTGTATGTGAASDCVATCDLSSDDGVNATLVAMGKPPQPKQYACIDHALDGKIAKLGDFAFDRGCAWNEVIVGCCLEPLGDDARLLGELGWAKMTPDQRAKLAPEYLAAIYQVRAESSAGPEFGAHGHPAFSAATTEAKPDGSVVYTGWFESSNGGGMTKATRESHDQRAYTISADGQISSASSASFSVPLPP